MSQNFIALVTAFLIILFIPVVESNSNLRSHFLSKDIHDSDHMYYRNNRSYTSHSSSNPIVDFFFGFIFIFGAIPVIWYNERRQAINEYRLKEATKKCTSINCLEYNPNTELQLVHLNGETQTQDLVVDYEFGISEPKTVKLCRRVEMYQWIVRQETQQQNGYEERRMVYTQEWRDEFVESEYSDYNHKNDKSKWTVLKQDYYNPNVQIGAYVVPQSLKEELSNYQDIPLNNENVRICSQNFANRAHSHIYQADKYIMFAQRQGITDVGDLRISFVKIPCGPTTIISQQVQNTFESWKFYDKFQETLENDSEAEDCGCLTCCSWCCCGCCKLSKMLIQPITLIHWIWPEFLSKDKAFDQKKSQEACITLVIRIIGYIIIGFGFCLIFSPISTIISWIPLLGYYLAQVTSFIFGVISFIIAIPLTLLVIAIAWLYYHPKVGIALILIAIAIIVGMYYFLSNQEQKE